MKNKLIIFFPFCFFIIGLAACSQTKHYTPRPTGFWYRLSGMPAKIVRVEVNDLRREKEESEELVGVVKSQILVALSPERIPRENRALYCLKIDILEHHSSFKLGIWNASTKFHIKLIDSNNNMVGNWTAQGISRRGNLMGYQTAEQASQAAYNAAVADMMSALSSVSLRKE